MSVRAQRILLILALLPLGTALLLETGCVSAPPPDEFNALQKNLMAMAHAREEYEIQPGDGLRITIYRGGAIAPEYSGDVTVQPDHRISLIRLEKPIDTTRQTMQEFQERVQEAYYPLFASGQGASDFRVTAQFLNSAKTEWLPDMVYVMGEVRRGQAVPYRKGLTVLQAVTQSGGWLTTARYERTVLLRRTVDGRTVTREFDLEDVVEHEGDDMEVFPNDVIYIPLSPIALVDLWMDQYVRQLLPINPSGIVRIVQ
jgi:protein involved in polysaccharide export with SLBB domain